MPKSPAPQPRWLAEAAAALADRVTQRGMTLPVAAAGEFLAQQTSAVADLLGVSSGRHSTPYLNDTVLDDLADQIVAAYAAEEPGADLFALPRSAHVSVSSLGRLISGLAETLLFFDAYAPISDADRSARRYETTQLLSLVGLIQSEHTEGGNITAPPAVLARIARTLTAVAEMTDDAVLAAALRRDAIRAHTAAAGTHS
ncbi:MAG: hypothetical protein QG597_1625 [Actinomycetota bacterium]|nr:hypothetical protein [Actinomycetota bacterium]